MPNVALPPEFSETLDKVQKYGILNEDARKIHERLQLAVDGVAAVEVSRDLGLFDTIGSFMKELKVALHKELCDPTAKSLKSDYNSLLQQGLTTDGVAAVAAVVTKVVSAINPAFLVSTIVIYAAVWLLKIGLTLWCSTPLSAAVIQP